MVVGMTQERSRKVRQFSILITTPPPYTVRTPVYVIVSRRYPHDLSGLLEKDQMRTMFPYYFICPPLDWWNIPLQDTKNLVIKRGACRFVTQLRRDLFSPPLLRIWRFNLVAAAAQVRPLNWCAVVPASTVGSPLYRENTLATRCPNVYLAHAGSRNLTCNLCGLQVSSPTYTGLLGCRQEAINWVGWV
jgi:hypothetical protein